MINIRSRFVEVTDLNQQLKEKIKLKAEELGIDKIGFTHAEPFYTLEDRLKQQRAAGHNSGFEHKNIEERIYPEKIFEQPKSIIAIALAYPSRMKKPRSEKGKPRGEFARASWGTDYHHILNDRMNKLIAYIKEAADEENIGSVDFKPMVDTGELVDVAVAQRAGLGFIGRNGLLITEEFGSFVYLGEIITNIDFEADEEVPFGCGDCMKCIDACPTGALLGDGRINAQVCLSYQTQTKGYMPEEFRKKMGRVIYGCDICQVVCPYNRGINTHHHEEMEPDPELTNPVLEPLLDISNREFKESFGKMAGSWRGKKPLQRNAIIALANYREKSAIPKLLQVIETDPRPMIRGTAAWAIAKITEESPNQELILFLEEMREKEDEAETISEFNKALDILRTNM
ncbi:MAG: tRNA epoxyqueuosine(34) reductase QueG [Ruoffia tabacinasalis]|uniref:tRNA epoxyqueuosine(34) reductase QueG n=1 Tax=Ruoffia sp. FAM 26254 TaxID=3259518 RepID=UPI000EE2AEE5|nr:tRNA epoxyqueuosine(34) reductase QueG [Aerococcaceae bacterium]